MTGRTTGRLVLTATLATFLVVGPATGEPPPPPGGGKVEAAGPRWPGGRLGESLGEYLTIEGVRAEEGKVGTQTLIVDTVGGKKLAKPVHIWVANVILPAGKRCVLKGYETGSMIGQPPAVFEAAKEQGRNVGAAQAEWQWHPHFVVLIPVEPRGLKVVEE
jgi:hypothetical protein